MVLEIEDGRDHKCIIKLDGKRVLNCSGYKLLHDVTERSPRVVLYLSTPEINFTGTIKDLVLERDET